MERLTKRSECGLVSLKKKEGSSGLIEAEKALACLGDYEDAMEAAGLEKPTDIAALQAEVQRLQAIVERNEPWFNQNAALLAAHNIGGFTFAEGKQDGK